MRRMIFTLAVVACLGGCLLPGSKTEPLTMIESTQIADSDLPLPLKKKLLGNEVVLAKDRSMDAKIDKGLQWGDELTMLLSALGVGGAGAAGLVIRKVRKKRAAEKATAG